MKISVNTGLLPLLPLLSTLGACSGGVQAPQPPNIIFIMTDDHAWQAVSAYGGRLSDIAPTPNIDRVAHQGMRFDRCLVTNSICGPSRATILTGKYGHLNGFYSNEMDDFDGSQQTFPKLLQQAGYQTAIIGKWHLGSEPTGFHHWDILPGQGNYYNPDFIDPKGTYRVEGYVTDIITEKSIAWLEGERDKDKPFLLMMHHKAPHREWEPGPKYLHHFEGVTFPEPATLLSDNAGRGAAAREQDMTIARTLRMEADLKMWDTSIAGGPHTNFFARLNEGQKEAWNRAYMPVREKLIRQNPQGDDLVRWKYQRYMNDYLACIQSVDESVGIVLDYLKKNGLDKNTIIVYTSDQGFFLGEHGWFDKRFMYEESYRTPLLISWPGITKAGTVNKDIVSNLDFAQTFLEMANVDQASGMQGASMVPLLKGKTPPGWRREHYYHYYAYPDWHMVKRHYGIADNRYKLMHFYFDIDEWEMYDLENDPDEMTNIYNDPDYADVREDLHRRLDAIREQYGDSDELTRSFLPANPDEAVKAMRARIF